MKHRLATISAMVAHGESLQLPREFFKRLYSNQTSVILRANMRELPPLKLAKLPMTVRPVEDKDIPAIVSERPRRLGVLRENIPTCFVAMIEHQIAYMQWCVAARHWSRFAPYFVGDFHKDLANDECVFEFAYTFKRWRGMGVMGCGMGTIAHLMAQERPDLNWGYTYVLDDNAASLKGCYNAGFFPHMERHEQWRALHMNQQFKGKKNGN